MSDYSIRLSIKIKACKWKVESGVESESSLKIFTDIANNKSDKLLYLQTQCQK